MAGPQKAAPVKPGDSYLLVNDRDEDLVPWQIGRQRAQEKQRPMLGE
jgi:hypothetical protein